MVCYRVLCWTQFSLSSAQNLFLSWFSVTQLSPILAQTILSTKSLSLHWTFNLQYLLWKPVCQTSRPGCWKTNLNLAMIKQRPSSCTHLLSPLQSPNLLLSTTISVCGYEISFSSSAKNLGFYIRDYISIELHTKNVCWSAYSELRRISTIQHVSVDSTKTLVFTFVLSMLDYCNSLLSGCPKHLEKTTKGQELSFKTLPQSSYTRWCFTLPQNSSLAAHSSTYRV